MVVVLSQVPPGFTRSRQRPAGALYYQVETLIFGRAIERDAQSGTLHHRLRRSRTAPARRDCVAIWKHGCPILPMRFESAELAKISINMCLIASVGVANMMAELCERVGADWNEIVPSLRLDRRIGKHSYINAGLGLSGGNLERDVATVCRLAATSMAATAASPRPGSPTARTASCGRCACCTRSSSANTRIR